MHPSGWIQLLQRFPTDQIDNLCLVTGNGTELSLQSLVRLDEEFLLVRARVSGSSDAGRAFFIPYDQITYLGFQKPVKEDALMALFGEEGVWAQAEPQEDAPPEDGPAEELPPEELEAVPTEPEPAKPVPAHVKESQALPTKAQVLANLRARLKSGSNRRGTK